MRISETRGAALAATVWDAAWAWAYLLRQIDAGVDRVGDERPEEVRS